MKNLEFSNGDRMSALGLGTWKSAPGEAGPAIVEAIRMGYRHIDCAAIYGNETEIGAALAKSIGSGVVKREDLWITSKLWNAQHSPADVGPALQQSLTDLRLDYLDLYLIHWPLAFKSGVHFPQSPDDTIPLSECPTAETWRAMESCVTKGIVRHLGVANFSLAKLKALVEVASTKPSMNQIELHPYLQQSRLLEFCKTNGVHLTAYAPLGSGGRPDHLKATDEPVLLEEPVIVKIANQNNATPAQVLLAWGLGRGTAVIPKSVNPQRLKENLVAADLTLTVDEMAEINGLDRNRRYFGGEMWSFEGTSYTLASLWDGD